MRQLKENTGEAIATVIQKITSIFRADLYYIQTFPIVPTTSTKVNPLVVSRAQCFFQDACLSVPSSISQILSLRGSGERSWRCSYFYNCSQNKWNYSYYDQFEGKYLALNVDVCL